jgi:DNA processing protein
MPAPPDRSPGTTPSVRVVLPGAWPATFARTQGDLDALLVLSHLQGIRPLELHGLAWREGSASACLRAIRAGAEGSAADRRVASAVEPRVVREAMDRVGVRLAPPGSEEYPEDLLALPDPPACLFVRGSRAVPWTEAVAVVGARSCSAYGREMALELGAGLARAGVLVVSGAARGIDAAAHRGALWSGGRTSAVLGSGIDVLYPYRNRRLLEEIAGTAPLFSEYPPGIPPHQRRFPARNRIVAALCRVTVVVEGASGSGSLLTARFADQLSRDVMAVPGAVTGPLSAAPNELLRDGAVLARGPDDVLEMLGRGPARSGDQPMRAEGKAITRRDRMTEDEHRVLAALSGSGELLDSVARRTGLAPARVLSILMSLELRGLVRSPGGRFERTAAATGTGRGGGSGPRGEGV